MTFELEPQDTNILRSASVGAIVGGIITTTLLSHLLYHYRSMFHKKDPSSPQSSSPTNKSTKSTNTTAYILVMIYISCCLIQIIALLFIRTNIITRISPSDFTLTQCATGFIINWFGTFSAVAMLYVIFIHRIYIVFKDSIYEYKSYYFYTLYIMTLLFFCTLSVLRITAYLGESEWKLAHDHGQNVIYCRNKTRLSLRPLSIFLSTYIVIMSIALLWMFSSKLVLFQRERTKYFVDTHRGSSLATSIEMGNVSKDKNGNFSLDAVYDTWKRRRTPEKEMMSREVEMIFILHDLIKKQTILVCIAVLSSVSLWGLVAFENHYFWEIVWDIGINSICVWLMLKSSKKYWIWCTKYGLCLPCYYKENSTFSK